MNLNDIVVSERLRPLNAEWVAELERSIAAIGLRTPISIRFVDDKPTLVAGAHRLQAVKNLGWDQIPVCVFDGDERAARMWEIAENLHRAELTALERSEQTAEWTRLVKEAKAQLAPSHPGHTGGRRDQGINAAVRELGISRTDAQRAVKIDSLAPEAKAKAVELGLDDNQSALLEAAKAETADEQVEVLKKRKERKSARKDQPAPAVEAVSEEAERRAEELRTIYTGVRAEVPQVQKLYLALSDQEQTYFWRWLKSQRSKSPEPEPVEERRLHDLPFDDALPQFKSWYSALTPAEQQQVEVAIDEAEPNSTEPASPEPAPPVPAAAEPADPKPAKPLPVNQRTAEEIAAIRADYEASDKSWGAAAKIVRKYGFRYTNELTQLLGVEPAEAAAA